MTFDTSTVFSDLKLGHKGLLSKKKFLRPNWHGSASSYIPSQWVGGKKNSSPGAPPDTPWPPHWRKKNFFSKNVVFWFFQKKIELSHEKWAGTRKFKIFKIFLNVFLKMWFIQPIKKSRISVIFFRRAEKPFWLVNKPL